MVRFLNIGLSDYKLSVLCTKAYFFFHQGKEELVFCGEDDNDDDDDKSDAEILALS